MSLFKEKLALKIEEAEFAAQRAFWGFSEFSKWLLIILLVGSIPVYIVSKTIAFQYWKNKLKTYKTSAKSSFETALGLNISQPYLSSYPDKSYGASVKIINPNPDLYIGQFRYFWKFYNTAGEEILPINLENFSGLTYILPKSTKYLVVPKIVTTQSISKAELFFNEPLKWQKKISLASVNLVVSPAIINRQTSPELFSVESTVLNNSPYKIKETRLVFLVYDQNQKLIAVSQRSEYDLTPFEKRAFKQIWPNFSPFGGRVEIFAETNVLDSENLTLTEQQSNSSDLSRPKEPNYWDF